MPEMAILRRMPLSLLLALPAVMAVSLQDFPPRLSNLQSSCQSVYSQNIPQCSGSDFGGSGGCSVACINALNAMEGPVKQACGNQGIQGENIIVAFLANSGAQSVCGNANSVFSQQSASAAAQQSTSPPPSASRSKTSSTPSTASTSTSTTTSASSASSTMSSLLVDTSSASMTSSSASLVFSGTLTATTSSASSSSVAAPASTSSSATPAAAYGTSSSPSASASGSSQYTNDHSGGGSPFDSSGNGKQSSAASRFAVGTAVLSMASGVLIFAASGLLSR